MSDDDRNLASATARYNAQEPKEEEAHPTLAELVRQASIDLEAQYGLTYAQVRALDIEQYYRDRESAAIIQQAYNEARGETFQTVCAALGWTPA